MSTTTPDAGGGDAQAPIPEGDDDEISLLEMLQVLWEYKWLLIGSTLGAGVLAAGITLMMPNYYTATARILPPQQSSTSTSALLGQLGGLAAAAGGSMVGLRNPNELYVGMLKSRTISDRLVDRFDLLTYFEVKLRTDARAGLESATRIVAGKDGIISISVEMSDPATAAKVADSYAEELIKLSRDLALTEAAHRRKYFERELTRVKEEFSSAERAVQESLSRGGLSMVEGQGRALLDASSRLRAQITAKEVQIGAMSAYATSTNPELRATQQELQSLKSELARVEGSGTRAATIRTSPEGANNARLLRELRFQSDLYDFLSRQLDAARLDESREPVAIQLLDRAAKPERKSAPHRGKIVVTSASLWFIFFAVGLIGFRSFFMKKLLNPRASGRGA